MIGGPYLWRLEDVKIVRHRISQESIILTRVYFYFTFAAAILALLKEIWSPGLHIWVDSLDACHAPWPGVGCALIDNPTVKSSCFITDSNCSVISLYDLHKFILDRMKCFRTHQLSYKLLFTVKIYVYINDHSRLVLNTELAFVIVNSERFQTGTWRAKFL